MESLNNGEQHTFMVFGLCVVEMTMTVLRPALDAGNQKAQCTKIFRWIEECHAAVKYKHIAVPARRTIEHLTQEITPFISTEHMTDEERLHAWAKNLWMALTFASDLTAICPDYYRTNKRKFEFLYRTVLTLAERFLQLYPDADVCGVERYCHVMTEFENVINHRK